eukprot:CAMPEP_0174269994 /NCGR_PEP_ID=MMETSP0439-20130205/42902_1 /TAXON_ID=0 /ORGANISM="Stereomyxa ramosa, Strain Chinc5" /LENGTH=347 /DNA_ID=CAMNT_0015359047 /DNA_START=297 /DNA_END=1337 /DNA_ORIENTATION=+
MEKQRGNLNFQNYLVPEIILLGIEYVLKYLDTEGLFRVSAEAGKIQELKIDLSARWLQGQPSSFDFSDAPHLITGLMKLFLRELSEPLWTYEVGAKLLDCLGEQIELAEKIKEIIKEMPIDNVRTLYAVLSLMHQIALNSDFNKMDSDNLARTMGPNFYWSESKEVALDEMSRVINLTQFMIENVHILFDPPVSSFGLISLPQDIVFRKKFVGPKKSVLCMALTSTGFLWAIDSSGVVRIYDAMSMEFKMSVETRESRGLCMCAIGNNVWVGFQDCVEVRNAENGELQKVIEWYGYCILHHYTTGVWIGGEQKIQIYDNETFELISEVEINTNAPIVALATVGEKIW